MANTGKGKYITNGKVNKRFINLELMDQYLIEHPEWHTGFVRLTPVSNETRNKHRKNMINNTRALGKRYKRGPLSDETKRKLSEINRGKIQPQEVRDKISKANRGRVSAMKGKHHRESSRLKISKVVAGSKNPFFNKHHDEKTKEQIRKSMAEYLESHEDSKLWTSEAERRIFKYLSNYFEVIPQFLIEGYSHPYDMLVKLPNSVNLLIEYDGDYWHKGTDYSNDPRKITAKDNGFEFLVIKESDYFNNGQLKYAKSKVAEYFPELLNYHLN